MISPGTSPRNRTIARSHAWGCALVALCDRRANIEAMSTDEAARPSTAIDEARPFTAKQGQYLAFIYYYTKIHHIPPAEAVFQRFFPVTPPVVHGMIKALQAHGFIDREPGKARSIALRLTRAQLPDLD
jgi:DNA-binding MarR family transcriptional regulator